MRKVLLYSILLVAGLALSVPLGWLNASVADPLRFVIRVLTMLCLGFIMIHVGYEFEIDRRNLRGYALDYGVAATAAAFPWIFCSVYFAFLFLPNQGWMTFDGWKDALLAGRFAAPTSAGILFSMLAAAGLSATWLFKKARILAIFDDLDTVLLMIPLKALIVGLQWQLGVIILLMVGMLWLAWRFLHQLRWPITWPWVMMYAGGITVVSEIIYYGSKFIDDVVPIHIEVLLPAFVLGCMLARPHGQDPHVDDAREGHQEGPESPEEQKVSGRVSAVFMMLVGLSVPPMFGSSTGMGLGMSWGTILLHVGAITILSNLGKMFPLFVYRSEAGWRERLALCLGMWPRGEVGAGVLIVSLSYGISQAMVTVATLSLAINLLATGLFILGVQRLLRPRANAT